MKKIIALFVAAAFVLSLAGLASAAHEGRSNFGTSGYIQTSFGGTDNSNFGDDPGDTDDFTAGMRVRQFFDYIASENLKATVGYEIDTTWGGKDAPIGADAGDASEDGDFLELKRANIDFTWPGTELQVKSGIQWLALPGGVIPNPVLYADGAGITASTPLGDMGDLTFGWVRALDNTDSLDAEPGMDVFHAALPISQDGINVSPFAAYSVIGQQVRQGNSTSLTYEEGATNDAGNVNDVGTTESYEGLTGLYGKGLNTINREGLKDSADAYWVGTSFGLNSFDPVGVKGSFIYGALNTDKDVNERKGWFADLAVNLQMEMMTPELFTIYATGEDDDPSDGSEAFPMINNDGTGTMGPNVAVGDSSSLGTDIGGTSLIQVNPAGLWQMGFSLKHIKMSEKLSSTFTATYYQGTNDEEVGWYLDNSPHLDQRLTEEDSAYELALQTKYSIYENLSAIFEANYVKADMEETLNVKTNGNSRNYDRGSDYMEEAATRLGASLKYNF